MEWLVEAFCMAIFPLGILLKFLVEPILGLFNNPLYFILFILNGIIQIVASLLPEVPPEMRLSTHVNEWLLQGSLAANMGIEMIKSSIEVLIVTSAVKVYKLVPGKFS